MNKNRYPGTQPFTSAQENLFFGRELETKELLKLIQFQQMVVLYGKSGLGKSSLLNAKIIQEVKQQQIAQVFPMRFNAWTKETDETPLSKTRTALLTLEGLQTHTLAPIADNSLWYAIKARQMATKQKRFLLVFDQFEELFTYPDAEIKAFKDDFAELLRSRMPKRMDKAIQNLQLSDADLDTFYENVDVKVLFAIRSDRMHLLDKLSDVLPDILRHCYELKALIEPDAREAITKPAALVGDFDVPTFTYTGGALSDIVSFLKDENGRIEAIQLQTLCQAFERTIHREGSSITAADTPMDKLKAIIDDYYKTQLNHDSITDKHTAHRLIEDELVIETGDGKGVRVTLHELSILVKFANRNAPEADEKIRLKHLLDALVNVHLLRREVGSRGGDTYELAHDRLVEPVLTAKKVYEAEVERQKAKEETERREGELAEAKRQAWVERRRSLILSSILIAFFILFFLWVSQYYKSIKNVQIVREIVVRADSLRYGLNYSRMMQVQQDSNSTRLLQNTLELQMMLKKYEFFYKTREVKVENNFQEYDNLKQLEIQTSILQKLLQVETILKEAKFARDSAVQMDIEKLRIMLQQLNH
jgi:hypothetical protein